MDVTVASPVVFGKLPRADVAGSTIARHSSRGVPTAARLAWTRRLRGWLPERRHPHPGRVHRADPRASPRPAALRASLGPRLAHAPPPTVRLVLRRVPVSWVDVGAQH